MDVSRPPAPAEPAPFVSVIVPVYNDERGLGIALRALLAQRYAPDRYEIIIVDNGSADGTLAAARGAEQAHPGRVRVLTEHAQRGSYAARNCGIAAARGTVLAFTDADCAPAPDWIGQGVAALAESGAALAAGRIDMTFRGAHPNVWEHLDAVGKLNQQRYVEAYGFGATANLFVQRAAVERHGAFRADLISGGDYEFGRRLTGAGEKAVYAAHAVVRHPARAAAGEVFKKERRIQQGRFQLERLGLLRHGLLTWRSFVPVRACPPLAGVDGTLTRRVGFIAAANAVRYFAVAVRLADRAAARLRARAS